jgi:excisionase family DNA binding protein
VARQMLTIEEAAKYLGTTARHVRRLVSDHSLSYYKVGGRVRFADVDLDAWLDARRIDGSSVTSSYRRRTIGARAGGALADRSASK